jgi:hypothetical protein
MSNVSGGAVSPATDEAHPHGPSRQLRRSFALLVFLILPLSLRLWPVQHGLPRIYVPDGHMVRNAMGMARDGDLVPPAGKYSSYPYLVPYMLLGVYAAQYGVGDLLGRWQDARSFGEYAMDNPASVILPARVLVALLGAATVWLTYRCAREMGLGLGAWVAGWLVCTGLLHVHFSVQERPWIPMLFFATLSMWAAERFRRTEAARDLMLSAACAGLSFACHQVGLVFFGVTALSLFVRRGKGLRLARMAALGVGALGLFAVVALLLGHPYYLRYGMVPAEVAERPGDLPSDFHIGGQAALIGFSLNSIRHLAVSFFGYDPALCCLALIGMWPALRERSTRAMALFACFFGAFFLPYPNDHVRYLLPLTVLLAFPAGVCAERLLTLRNGAFALSLLLVLPLVQAVRFGWVMNQRDTRADGEELIASLDSGLVAVDRYGPTLELDAASLERVQGWRELTLRERNRLRKLGENAPVERGASAVRVEDVFEGRSRGYGYVVREPLRKLGETPDEVLKRLGVRHLLLVDRRPGDGRAPELWESAQRGQPTYMIQPGAGETQTREALLPTEMDFALTAIWLIDRPGPWLCLYDLETQ